MSELVLCRPVALAIEVRTMDYDDPDGVGGNYRATLTVNGMETSLSVDSSDPYQALDDVATNLLSTIGGI